MFPFSKKKEPQKAETPEWEKYWDNKDEELLSEIEYRRKKIAEAWKKYHEDWTIPPENMKRVRAAERAVRDLEDLAQRKGLLSDEE